MSYNVESTVSWHISAFGGKIWELEKGEKVGGKVEENWKQVIKSRQKLGKKSKQKVEKSLNFFWKKKLEKDRKGRKKLIKK